MSDLFVVAEAHPYWPSPSSWRDDDPFVLVMGVDNPSALAVWVREYDVGGVVIVHRAQTDRQVRFMANLASGAVPGLSVTTVTHRGSALAAALACREVAPWREPLASKVEWLERILTTARSGVVLSSVAGLHDPNPGIMRHLASLLPWGPPFVVQFTPGVEFVRLPNSDSLFEGGVGSWHVTEGDGPLPCPFQLASVERPVADVRAEYGGHGREFALLGWPSGDREYVGCCPVCGVQCVSVVCPVCHVHVLVQESVA